jgi:hypothetical protein
MPPSLGSGVVRFFCGSPGTRAWRNLARGVSWCGRNRSSELTHCPAPPYAVACDFYSTITGNTAFSRFVVATTSLCQFWFGFQGSRAPDCAPPARSIAVSLGFAVPRCGFGGERSGPSDLFPTHEIKSCEPITRVELPPLIWNRVVIEGISFH